MKTTKRTIALVLSTAMAVLSASGDALAAKGSPGPGGGGGGEVTASQNLSVPAILVGSLTLPYVCGSNFETPSDLTPPTGVPSTGYEVPGYYWVQKVNQWQAQCFTANKASVFGAWGDNLTGDAKLKTGSPIRVELVLTNTDDYSATTIAGGLQGYNVIKLQPSLLDRESAYGHEAVTSAGGDTPIVFQQATWVVHDAGMKLSVEHLASGTFPVPLQPIKPEINATGKIVYGYNLRVNAAGTYRIRFNAPTVKFTGVDAGSFDNNNAYLDIVVGGGGGGGKKGGGRP
jgi:hypothetical protein